MFHTDKTRFKEILMILLGNAAKYTFQGSIILEVSKIIRDSIHYLKYKIKDTGTGIKKTNLPFVFDVFGLREHNLQKNQTGFLCISLI